MKEFLASVVVAILACSGAWWLGSGTDPVQQLSVLGRQLSSVPFIRQFRLSGDTQHAWNDRSRRDLAKVVGARPDLSKGRADRRLQRRA